MIFDCRFTVIPWNNGTMEEWNNDSRTKRTFRTLGKMQRKIDAMPDTENATFRIPSVSIIPIFQYSIIPHPYGMLLIENHKLQLQ